MSLTRGCGRRKNGGLYMVTNLSSDGYPIGHFIIDPVTPIEDPAALGITPVGVTTIEREDLYGHGTGVYDLWDWIGAGSSPCAKGYWNVADFIEEGVRYGFSGYLPKSTDLSKITRNSRRILIHPHAYITQFQSFYADRAQKYCPKHITMHELANKDCAFMCAGLWWESIEGGKEEISGRRGVVRTMPPFAVKDNSQYQFGYFSWRAPDGIQPQYLPAAFMWLPFTLEVIEDKEGGTHEQVIEMLEKSGTDIPYELKEE